MKIKKICDFYELDEKEMEMIIEEEIHNKGGIEEFYFDGLNEEDYKSKEEYLRDLEDSVKEDVVYELTNEIEKIVIYEGGLYDIIYEV